MDFKVHQTLNYDHDSKLYHIPLAEPDPIDTFQAVYSQTNLIQTSESVAIENGVFQVYFS